MKILQLFTDNSEIIGSDGIMYVDGRYNIGNISNEVIKRNERMKNFPHKIATKFAIYKGNIRSGYGQIFNI